MRAPEFWQTDGVAARLISPLGQIYGMIGRWRRYLATPEDLPVPVICVGNLTAGGTGKTPTAIALAERVIAAGETPHFVTRGYGGRLLGPAKVTPGYHGASDVGDEPLLLSRVAPTWVSRNRVLGARAAVMSGASLIILDDGHQNPHLGRDLGLVVVDASVGFGNQRLIPAGPLRESVAEGLARADAVILIGDGSAVTTDAFDMPVLPARMRASATAPELRGKRVLPFAGIGRPDKFFGTLRELGADIVSEHAFPDHHPYKPSEIETLIRLGRQVDAACITTEKDYVRIPLTLRHMIEKLPIEISFDTAEGLDRLLASALARKRPT